jgi:hypothetical protein
MITRTILSGLFSGLLLVNTAHLGAADGRTSQRGITQSVGRAGHLALPKRPTPTINKSATTKRTAATLKLNPQPQPSANPRFSATAKSPAPRFGFNPPRASAQTGSPRSASSSSVLQLKAADRSDTSGKVLTLVNDQPPVLLVQFQAEDESQSAALIMPLGATSDESEPAATLLQFGSAENDD